MNMNDADEICPKNKKDWRKWLEVNHKSEDAVWLIFYKKKSPNHNLTWSESVDEALCFGWVDSLKKTIDAESYKQYFSKRKPKSNWSKINKEKVQSLIEKGLMKEEGYKSIEIAKENGYWSVLDDVEDLVIPDDLLEAFSNFKGSKEFFDGLSNSMKKGFLYWVVSAKRESTRRKRILEIVENASKNRKPKHFG